ncbi:LysR family transcriptional regulator [Comamonas piscis]|uniref:LysR family transcriptional regulator n=1 Tax=Comamonas piscis TaxID=1562974 RepID=A0A7G5EFJ1_9BURK|nr:LysR substrate-binding domain-containing protein [Comamonas piscis]QMV72766.1 LysR family transcriptional regulator [Comamonas piscis]WSO35541.1 LysR substrate-binding domain-containing protein [Comamonas piscis]
MRNAIPNIGLLMAFEASARHGNFSRAANELALTASAVSRHVAALEDRLGVPLFVRHKRRVMLTDAGKRYAQRVRVHLNGLERDTQEIANSRAQGYAIHLAVVSSFATQWLLPRLPAFAQQHPDIHVHLSVRSEPFAFEESGFDGAIYSGDGLWTKTQGQRIARDGACIPICSPAFAAQHALATQEDWQQLVHIGLESRPAAWRDWYNGLGWDYSVQASRGPRYELFSMVITAAAVGLGVGLVPEVLVKPALDAGQVVPAHSQTLPGTQSYWFSYPTYREPSAALQAFEQWVIQQSQEQQD